MVRLNIGFYRPYAGFGCLSDIIMSKNKSIKRRSTVRQRKCVENLHGSADVSGDLNIGLAHHQAGRLSEAQDCYKRVLAIDGKNADALHLLGVIGHQCGNFEPAIQLISKAISINPGQSGYYNSMGSALQGLKRFDEAMACFSSAVKVDPNNAEAYNNMGTAFFDQEKPDEAVECYNKAIGITAGHFQALNNIGNVYRKKGELDEAVNHYRKAIEINPAFAEAYNNIATVLREQEKTEEAIEYYRKAIERDGNNAKFYSNLGVSLYESGEIDEAKSCYEKSIEINPKNAETYINLGNLYEKDDKLRESIACYRMAVDIQPDNADAHNNFGHILFEDGNYDKAVEHFRKALEIDPDNENVQSNLINGLINLNELDDAFEHCRRIYEKQPDSPNWMVNMGIILCEMGNLKEAEELYDKALSKTSDSVKAYYSKGSLLQESGRKELAIKCYTKAIEINPNHTESYKSLAGCITFKEGDEITKTIESLLAKENLLPSKEMALNFALGKIYGDIGRYGESFLCYKAGNDIRKKLKDRHFSIEDYRKKVCQQEKAIDNSYFADYTGFVNESDVPVFIVGMPRSGTTLTEQIIASHPEAYGAGELPDIGKGLHNVKKHNHVTSFQELVDCTDEDFVRTFSKNYISKLESLSDGARRVVDKMPHNFETLWLIGRVFPNSRIIHCKRNPMDNCVSCYVTDFVKGHGYRNDLRVLGQYYKEYERLMDHWKKVVPVPILEVQYEEVVANQEEMSRKIIDFCKLEWDDRCLDFHKTKRSVKTASVNQVRKKIYNTSVERWRRYEKELGPLFEGLASE